MPSRSRGPEDPVCRWKTQPLQIESQDLHDKITAASASVSDPYEEAGIEPGINVWRVTKHRASHWPVELYGHFYETEVYIILHTIAKNQSKMIHTIYLWCGKASDPEDYSAGCYKVAELDERTHYEANVHREVQGRETEAFQELYSRQTTIWRGSSETNYFFTRGEGYQARLLRWYRPDKRMDAIKIKEVSTSKDSLNSEDIMLLDLGHQIYQWVGQEANMDEILPAFKYAEVLNANRGGSVNVEVINEGDDPDHFFYFYLQDGTRSNGLIDSDDETAERVSRNAGTLSRFKPVLLRVVVSGDTCSFRVVREGRIHGKDYKGHAITLFDSGSHCFVCFGSSATPEAKQLGLQYAHEYLRTTDHPLSPVTVLKKGLVTGDEDWS